MGSDSKTMGRGPEESWKGVGTLEQLPASLTDFLEASVAEQGDREFLCMVEGDRRISYAEFGRLADEAAAVLNHIGVRKGQKFGVLLQSDPLFPALFFAASRLGAAIVPINVRYTAHEIDHVADDAGIEALVVGSDLLGNAEASAVYRRLGRSKVVVVGDPESAPEASIWDELVRTCDRSLPEVHRDIHDLVGFQYTSGTTGLPKGCALSHEYWLVLAMTNAYLLPERSRILCDAPYFYMEGPAWTVSAMWSGGAVVLPQRPSLSRFRKWVSEYEVDSCWFPGPLLAMPEEPGDAELPLTHVFIDNLSPQQAAEVERRFGVLARDCFAMTETGMGTMVPWEDEEMATMGSIGVPLPFRECKVIDGDREELPAGREGELCLRGPGMFLGYHNKPEANAESFLPGDWFRTGDIAARDEQGRLFFRGRYKEMIRRSGENVAAREVELVLVEMPQIARAAVVPVPDEFRGEEVKAYIEAAPGVSSEELDPEAIVEWCKRDLAPFKLPRYIEFRDELPLTPSSKVAKKVLLDGVDDLTRGSYDAVDKVWL